MVVAYHLIWTAYGWWLPNDPRGSTSRKIRVEKFAGLGELHYERKAVQPLPAELRAFYEKAQELLAHPLLTFSDDDISLLGDCFNRVVREQNYTCYACAIMPDHVHLLIRRHRDKSERMREIFQEQSRNALIEAGRRTPTHPIWGGPGWSVFLNTREDIKRVVRYIENNPLAAGRPTQEWEFVTSYDGWLPANWYQK